MRTFKILLSAFLLSNILLIHQLSFAKKKADPISMSQYDEMLSVCERYYDDGDYEKALDQCSRILSKLKRGSQGYAVAYIQSYQAKYYEAMGNYLKFEETVRDMLKNKSQMQGKDASFVYGLAQLNVASLYAEYSYTNKAESFLDSAMSILKVKVDANGKLSMPSLDDNVRADALSTFARIYFSRGQMEKLLRIMPEVVKAKQALVTDEDQRYYDVVNMLYTTKVLDPIEKDRRKNEAAEMMTLWGDALRRRGDYKAAEAQLEKADAWIKENLNVRSTAFIRNQYIAILLRIDKGEKRATMQKLLEKNLFTAEKRLTPVHKLYMQIHESLIDNYIDSRYIKRSFKQRWEINQNTKKYYGIGRTQHAVANRLDAKADFRLQNYESAYEALTDLYKNAIKVPTNHFERINLLQQLYETALVTEGRFGEAINYLNELSETVERVLGKESLRYYYAQMELAKYNATYTNKFAETKKIIDMNFFGKIAQQITREHKDYVSFLNQMSDYHILTTKYDSSIYWQQQAIQIVDKKFGKENIEYGTQLARLVKIQMALGNYSEADKNANQALEIYRKEAAENQKKLLALLNKNQDRLFNAKYAEVLQTAASYYATVGLFGNAQSALTQANRLFAKSNASIANSSALDELAYLYIKMEQTDKAKDILERAEKLRKQRYGEDSRFLINPYNQLARVYLFEGDYIKADDYVNKALNIGNKEFGENSLQTTESIAILAELYAATGDYEKAKTEIARVIEILGKNYQKDNIIFANPLNELAIVRFLNGENLNDIEKQLLEVKGIISKSLGTSNPLYAKSAVTLASAYIENKKYDFAINELNESSKIWVRIFKNNRNTNNAEIFELLGDIESKKGSYKQAEYRYLEARKIYTKVLSTNHPLYTRTLGRLARTAFNANDFLKSQKYIDEAILKYKTYIANFFPALSDREKVKYWGAIKKDFEFYDNLLARRAKTDVGAIAIMYNNKLITKTLTAGSTQKIRNAINQTKDSTLIKSYNNWIEQKNYLIKVLAMSNEQQKEAGADPKRIQKEIDDLEKVLSRRSDIFKSKEKETTWLEVKNTLKSGEVAVEMIRYTYFDKTFTDSVVYAALILFPNEVKAPKFVPIPESNKLETTYLKNYRNSVKFGVKDKLAYQRYWKTVDNIIPAGSRIYLSSEGVYPQINIEAMLVEDNKYVIDEENIVLVTSTKDLTETVTTSTSSEEVVVVGCPVFYGDLKPEDYLKANNRKVAQLPGTYAEVQALTEILKQNNIKYTLMLTKDANEDSLKAKIKKPKILHIATHGFFEPDATENLSDNLLSSQRSVNSPYLRSGILMNNAGDVMADGNVFAYNKAPGVFTSYEWRDMDLEGTELVVMSACETGRSDGKIGESVYGLQRALQEAGAKRQVMSLFKVDDDATRALMTFYYKHRLEDKQDIRTSFINAKKDLRNDKKYSEPRFWGAFILIGQG
jgi:CHAT domain-containing protein